MLLKKTKFLNINILVFSFGIRKSYKIESGKMIVGHKGLKDSNQCFPSQHWWQGGRIGWKLKSQIFYNPKLVFWLFSSYFLRTTNWQIYEKKNLLMLILGQVSLYKEFAGLESPKGQEIIFLKLKFGEGRGWTVFGKFLLINSFSRLRIGSVLLIISGVEIEIYFFIGLFHM